MSYSEHKTYTFTYLSEYVLISC